MSLTLPAVPDTFFNALQPTLHGWAADLTSAPALMKPILRRAAPGSGSLTAGSIEPTPISVANSLEVFTLAVDSLASATPLTSARSIGWRFALTPGASSSASPIWIDYQPAAGTAAPALARIHQTPFQANLDAALAAAQASPQLASGDFSAAILETPALFQIGLWLRGPADAAGFLIPVASPYPALQLGTIYPATTYAAALQTILASRVNAPQLAQTATRS